MKPQILFVDDEPNILAAIRRTLNSCRDQWNIDFAESGLDAIEFMAQNHVDVVVTDMAMPEMDGKKLVYRLHELFPEAVPIILSGHWDIATSLRELGPSVRFLSKPISPDLLIWAVGEAVAEARFSVSSLLKVAPPLPKGSDTGLIGANPEAPVSWTSVSDC